MFRQDTKYREEITTLSRVIFGTIQGVWVAVETLSRVFDISSKSKQNLRN